MSQKYDKHEKAEWQSAIIAFSVPSTFHSNRRQNISIMSILSFARDNVAPLGPHKSFRFLSSKESEQSAWPKESGKWKTLPPLTYSN